MIGKVVPIDVRDGELASSGSWVYVVLDDAGLVVWVGATGLDPATRMWLHLNHADPEIGRLAAEYPRVRSSQLRVVAYRLADGLVCADVRDAVRRLVLERSLVSPDYLGPHDVSDPPRGAVAAAAEIVERTPW